MGRMRTFPRAQHVVSVIICLCSDFNSVVWHHRTKQGCSAAQRHDDIVPNRGGNVH